MEERTMGEELLNMFRMFHIKYDFLGGDIYCPASYRVYGNFRGFSSVRLTSAGRIEVDGMITDKEDFEKWLFAISV